MKFRLVTGETRELSGVTTENTFAEIEQLLNKDANAQQRITFINAGHTVDHLRTVGQEGLTSDSTVFIVARSAATSAPPTEPTSTDDVSTDDTPTDDATNTQTPVTQAEVQPAYLCSYKGAQVRIALNKNPDVLFNIIQSISRHNPFFLSYLAINPRMAQEHIDETLSNDEFLLIIKGDSVADDPIKPYLTHPSGLNGFEIDKRNLEYIVRQADFLLTDEIMATAKDIYLSHDRDIQKTIDSLKEGSALP